jgi:hypothetical protein
MTPQRINELKARFAHIADHMPGVQVCDDGTRWHPVELVELLQAVEELSAPRPETPNGRR